NPPILIKLTKLRYRLLNDAPTDTNAAHEAPIAVGLPVLPANRVAQIHVASEPHPTPKKIPKVGTTWPNQLSAPPKPLIRLTPFVVKSPKPTSFCASWANTTTSENSGACYCALSPCGPLAGPLRERAALNVQQIRSGEGF